MQESDTDRWELIMAIILLVLIGAGVYVARHEGPLILTPSSRKRPVSAKHKPKSAHSASSSSAYRGNAAPARAASSSGADNATDGDASIDGLEDCRNEAMAEAQAREVPRPPSAALQAAVARLDSDRDAAIDAMLALKGSAVPDAYLAYLHLEAGRADEARPALARARNQLPGYACPFSLQAPGDIRRNPIALALRTLRLALEFTRDNSGTIPLACSIFQSHPKEAVWAFGGMWGSEADSAGRVMKLYCIEQLVRRAAPGTEQRVILAQRKLNDSLLHTRAMPEGTMHAAIYLGVCNLMRDAVLAPELVTLSDERVSRDGLNQMATAEPALGKRITAYRAVVDTQAPIIGQGMCAILSARDKTTDAANCEHLARKTALEALNFWLSATETGGE